MSTVAHSLPGPKTLLQSNQVGTGVGTRSTLRASMSMAGFFAGGPAAGLAALAPAEPTSATAVSIEMSTPNVRLLVITPPVICRHALRRRLAQTRDWQSSPFRHPSMIVKTAHRIFT